MGKLLQYMTWQEAREYFKKVKFAIIPVGSTEQHGPHLPLGTDFLIAEHLARKVAEKVDVVVTPTVPVGFAQYHTSFDGTLYVEPEVLASYYKGITDSLELYGVTHFLFINGHGGNMEMLRSACRHLRIHGKTGAYFQWFHNAGKLNK
ncbi:creatininase family protein, partial [Patescibacteria group bacterium]|nr:creatininase family protein [Patescibacteria group bacterium]